MGEEGLTNVAPGVAGWEEHVVDARGDVFGERHDGLAVCVDECVAHAWDDFSQRGTRLCH
jgi:hypothetical protein